MILENMTAVILTKLKKKLQKYYINSSVKILTWH